MFGLHRRVVNAKAEADICGIQEREAAETLRRALEENHTARTRLLQRLASNENITFKVE